MPRASFFKVAKGLNRWTYKISAVIFLGFKTVPASDSRTFQAVVKMSDKELRALGRKGLEQLWAEMCAKEKALVPEWARLNARAVGRELDPRALRDNALGLRTNTEEFMWQKRRIDLILGEFEPPRQ
jgi:hypothetical protein